MTSTCTMFRKAIQRLRRCIRSPHYGRMRAKLDTNILIDSRLRSAWAGSEKLSGCGSDCDPVTFVFRTWHDLYSFRKYDQRMYYSICYVCGICCVVKLVISRRQGGASNDHE